MTTKRISYLDGIRAIGLLCIVVFHCYVLFPAPWDSSRAVDALFRFLWVGVDLFFVLSGFLITGILLRAKERQTSLWVFYFHRFLRIFPPYYAYLVFAALLLASPLAHLVDPVPSLRGWLWPLFHLQNLEVMVRGRETVPEAIIHLWSLAVEQHFYLLWPVVVMAFRPRSLYVICGLIIVLTPGLRWVALHHFGIVTYFQTFCRWDSLLMGAFIALLVKSHASQQESGSGKLHVWGAAVGSLATLATLVLIVVIRSTSHRSDGFQTIGYSFVSLMFAGWLLWLVTTPNGATIQRLLSGAALGKIAKYSYSMYLFHYPFCFIYVRVLDRFPIPPVLQWPILFVAVFGTAYFISILVWRFIEAPALALKEKGKVGKHSTINTLSCL